MSLETFIPAAFPALALAHFLALVSPGQDFFLITGHAIRYNLHGSRFICVGVALGNAIYIAITIIGWTGIRDMPLLFSIIELAGACYLLWIGFQLLKSKPADIIIEATRGSAPSPLRQLMLGLNSALLNPKNALFYMSLMAVILGNNVTVAQQIFCGFWMVMAVLCWDLFVASAIGHKRLQSFLHRKIHLIERGAGAILLSFGIGLIFQVSSKP